MTSVLLRSAEEGHAGTELPFEPVWFGVIAVACFVALLGLLWSFRNTLALDPAEHHDDRPPTEGPTVSRH